MLFTARNGKRGSAPVGAGEQQRARFHDCFPRVFAYVHSLTGDEDKAKDVAVQAFSQAFKETPDVPDDEFAVRVFTTTRDACRLIEPRARNGLSDRERELLALVFDARLSRDELRELTRTSEQALSTAILRALRKLRGGLAAETARTSFRPV